MTRSDDSFSGISRGRSLYDIRGTLRYGATAGTGCGKQHGIGNVSSLTQKRLLRSFLCDGENSLCVLTHTCECLKVCQYGQRYLQTLEEETDPKQQKTQSNKDRKIK